MTNKVIIDWEKVEESVEWHKKGNDTWAEVMLLSAITKEEEPEPEHTSVVYGKDGYTDIEDPRNPNNSRGHTVGHSIHLTVHKDTKYEYRNTYVSSIFDDNGNGGKHVARVKVPSGFNGQVILAYPYDGDETFANEVPHSVGQEIVINAKFTPPNLGPLAIYLKENGVRVSDTVANLGLPNGHHISFDIEFN